MKHENSLFLHMRISTKKSPSIISSHLHNWWVKAKGVDSITHPWKKNISRDLTFFIYCGQSREMHVWRWSTARTQINGQSANYHILNKGKSQVLLTDTGTNGWLHCLHHRLLTHWPNGCTFYMWKGKVWPPIVQMMTGMLRPSILIRFSEGGTNFQDISALTYQNL